MTHTTHADVGYAGAGETQHEQVTRRIGVLTIGQSPRPDRLGHDIQEVLGPGFAVVESGALDDLTNEEIGELTPRGPDDYRLITLRRDGQSVEVGKAALLPRLQARIADLEDRIGVDATLLMCTGAFPAFAHRKPLLLPQEALYGAVIGMAGAGRIGALIPLEAQREQARRKWREMGVADVEVVPANPYAGDPAAAVRQAAAATRDAGVDVLFMDCFGYDREMKAAARRGFDGPVVLARTLAARLIAEVSE